MKAASGLMVLWVSFWVKTGNCGYPATDDLAERVRRQLVWTYNSAIGMFLAFAVPVDIPERDVLFSWNIEANYNLPTNLSIYDLSPPERKSDDADHKEGLGAISAERDPKMIRPVAVFEANTFWLEMLLPNSGIIESFSGLNRTSAYSMIERRLDNFGLNGRQCLLRLICDIAKTPLSHNGLIGKLLEIIFLPSRSEREPGMDDAITAELAGAQESSECGQVFYKCPQSLIDLVSYMSS